LKETLSSSLLKRERENFMLIMMKSGGQNAAIDAGPSLDTVEIVIYFTTSLLYF
jgi:hypothetical protein